MPRVSQVIKSTRASSVLAGLAKRFPPRERIAINGKRFTPKQVAAIFEEYLEALHAVLVARAALSASIAKARAAEKRVHQATPWLKASVQSKFGARVDVFADFGWEMPKKPGPKTLAGKVEGAKKAKATREARG